jgi:hypothetical protein
LRFRLWGLLAPAGSIRARIAPPIAVSPTSARQTAARPCALDEARQGIEVIIVHGSSLV